MSDFAARLLPILVFGGILTGCERETLNVVNVSSSPVVVECAGKRVTVAANDSRFVDVSVDEDTKAFVTVGHRRIEVHCPVREEDHYVEAVVSADGSVTCGGT